MPNNCIMVPQLSAIAAALRSAFLMHMDTDVFQEVNGAEIIKNGAPALVAGRFTNAVRLGKTGWLRTAKRPLANIGLSDFTFEFWVRINAYGGAGDHDYVAFDFKPLQIGMGNDGCLYCAYYPQGWNGLVSNAQLDRSGAWVHVAITRTSGTMRMFFDGNMVASHGSWSKIDLSQTDDLTIGLRALNAGNVSATNGSWDIDELRIVPGASLYSQNFVPPTQPLTL